MAQSSRDTKTEANRLSDEEACEAIDHEPRSYMKQMTDFEQPLLSEAECVYDFEGVVVRESHLGEAKKAHAPGCVDPIKPLCATYSMSGADADTYKYKPPGVIPRNYYEPCRRCLDIIEQNGKINE